MATNAKPHVFLSYSRLEQAFALKLATALQNAGMPVWADCLENGIQAGDDWARTVEEALNDCHALIAVVSPGYAASKVCLRELSRADELRRTLFPVLLKSVPPTNLPLEIQRLQRIDFRQWQDDSAFAEALKLLVTRLRSEAVEVIGQRPDLEQEYLTSLITRLEGDAGIRDYICLAGESTVQSEEDTATERSGINDILTAFDPEFTLLLDRNPAWKREEEVSAPRLKLDDVLDGIKKSQSYVLLGEPGAGKTTTLKRLALVLAKRRLLDRSDEPLPLLLELSTWRTEPDVVSFAAAHFRFQADLQSALSTGDVLLLLDGLNEMGSEGPVKAQLIRRLLHSPPGRAHLVVTCRSQDYFNRLNLGIPGLQIQPMDADSVRRFATAYISRYPNNDPSDFLAELDLDGSPADRDRSLGTLARNPYLLTWLIFLYLTNRTLPHNRGTLFQRLVKFLWDVRELKRHTQGWIPFDKARPSLAYLGFHMIEEDKPTSVSNDYVAEMLGNNDLLHCSISANILEMRDQQVKFFHQLIQEYLAAVHIKDAMAKQLPDKLQFKWTEVIFTLCGLVKEDEIEPIILECANKNALIAGYWIKKSGVTVSSNTLDLVIQKLISEVKDAGEQVKRHYIQRDPGMSSSSVKRMEDAVDDYFYNPGKDLSELIRKIEGARSFLSS
jgi:hypothetical protein